MSPETLLQVRDLRVEFSTRGQRVEALSEVSFEVGSGETVVLVGESGSGKSVTALSIMRLLGGGSISGGSIVFGGEDLVESSEQRMRSIRGDGIAMIFQDPMTSLDPLFSIRNQLVEAIKAHRKVGRGEGKRRSVELLREVLMPDPESKAKAYPHHLSGGQLQRVGVAMALACSPGLLIADEPTTALDVTVEGQILQLIREIQREKGMSLLLVTHDMGVVAEMADRVVVMYAGKVVEQGSAAQIFEDPHHPYTAGLLASIPRSTLSRHEPLPAIPGAVPSLLQTPAGCRFHPRCPHAWDLCRAQEPPLVEVHGGHQTRCWLHASAPPESPGPGGAAVTGEQPADEPAGRRP